jgi:pyruvate formate lyase activating enzyme
MARTRKKKVLYGNIYDIQKYTVYNGPGVRFELSLKGCPLKCLWCHSPEARTFTPDLAWISSRCKGIEADGGPCLKVCPNGALSKGKPQIDADGNEITYPELDRGMCMVCFECARVCPNKALQNTLREISVDEVFQLIKQDDGLLENTGGGVTISGGEPMSQFEFTNELACRLKDGGYNVALDTSGYAKWENYEEILPCVDLFLFDLKHMDNDEHKWLTGVSNEIILENAQNLADAGAKMEIKFLVLPTLNDSEENVRATAEFCVSLGDAVTRVAVLPFSKLGSSKYTRLGKAFRMDDIPAPTPKLMDEVLEIFLSYGLNAEMG